MAAGRKRRKETFPRGTAVRKRVFSTTNVKQKSYYILARWKVYFFSSWERKELTFLLFRSYFSNHGILFPYFKPFPPPPRFETHAKYAKTIGGSVEINRCCNCGEKKKRRGVCLKNEKEREERKGGRGFREKSRIDKAERCLCIRNSFSKDACVGRKILNLSFLLT